MANSTGKSKTMLNMSFQLTVAVICCLTVSARAQLKDSLLRQLSNAKEDTNKVIILDRLCYGVDNPPDKIIEYASAQLKLSEKLNYLKGMAWAYSALGKVYFKQGNYDLAVQYFLKGIDKAEQMGDKRFLAPCYSNVGSVLGMNNDYKEALKYFTKAFEMELSLGDNVNAGRMMMNIGVAYKSLGNLDKALDAYKKGIDYIKPTGNKQFLAESFENLGILYSAKKDNSNAVNSFREAIRLEVESNDNYGLASTNINFGIFYNELKKYNEAINKLDSGLNYVVEFGDKNLILTAYSALADAYKGLKQPEKENIYLRKYFELKDTVFSEEKSEQINELKIKYETEIKEHEIELLKQKEAAANAIADKRKLYSIIILISALLLIAVLLIFNVRSKNKKRQLELEFERNKAVFEQQAIRAQMNPHFIFNSLNSVQSYILNNETQKAYDYLAKFSKLIRQVLANSEQDNIKLKDEIELLNIYLDLEHRRFKNRFDYTIDCSEDVPVSEINVPVMLIQPFVENAIWHGIINLDKGINGNIAIKFNFESEILKITIEDNGVGREEAAKRKPNNEYKSVGMLFTQKRLDLLKVTGREKTRIEIVDLKNEAGQATGTRIEIYLPVD